VGHACLEAGFRFEQPESVCNLVLLSVANEQQLLLAVERIASAGIHYAIFHEPDDGMGYTAACSEPVTGDRRRPFRRYPLWDGAADKETARPPPETEASRAVREQI